MDTDHPADSELFDFLVGKRSLLIDHQDRYIWISNHLKSCKMCRLKIDKMDEQTAIDTSQ